MYFVPWEPRRRQIRPGVEQCDHGLDLDLDGTLIGIMWVIRNGTLSLETASTPVSDSLLDYQRLPIDNSSMWNRLIAQQLTSVGWSDRLECALEISFSDVIVTIAAADWREGGMPPIRQCSDGILVLFGEDWSGDVDR